MTSTSVNALNFALSDFKRSRVLLIRILVFRRCCADDEETAVLIWSSESTTGQQLIFSSGFQRNYLPVRLYVCVHSKFTWPCDYQRDRAFFARDSSDVTNLLAVHEEDSSTH